MLLVSDTVLQLFALQKIQLVMIAEVETTIIEKVRAIKEANAAERDFDITRIFQAARERQDLSGREITRQDAEPTANNFSH